MRYSAANDVTSAADIYAQAIAALNRSDWLRAQQLAMQMLASAPDNAGVRFVAGVAALRQGQLVAAVEHLRRAVMLDTQRADYLAQLARALAAMRMPHEALQAADRACALSPTDAQTLNTLGVVYTQANAHEQALVVTRRAVEVMPDRASYRFNYATLLTFLGQMDAAQYEYESCLSLDQTQWKAHLALSQLHRQTAAANHVERLQTLLAGASGNSEALLYLNLALAKEYEDLGHYEQAFRHLCAGKSSHRATSSYSFAQDETLFDALLDPRSQPQTAKAGNQTCEPIFVIGMPRSGTTLVDRILSSHSQVSSAGELQNFGVSFKRASGSRTSRILDPDTIARAPAVDWQRLGSAYLESTRPGTGQKLHFIDKLPHNFLYVGFIAHALPNAKIICLRRDPMDTCLSNFRQLFALSSPYYDYSFDLLDAGRYYLQFDRLMKHWHRVLPGRILEIGYESIVDDLKGSANKLLAYCDLPWEAACMAFESNAAPVATASAVQVREPINRKSIGRWRRYETQLQELRRLLREGGVEA